MSILPNRLLIQILHWNFGIEIITFELWKKGFPIVTQIDNYLSFYCVFFVYPTGLSDLLLTLTYVIISYLLPITYLYTSRKEFMFHTDTDIGGEARATTSEAYKVNRHLFFRYLPFTGRQGFTLGNSCIA